MQLELPPGYVDLDRGRVRVVSTRLYLDSMVALLESFESEAKGATEARGGRGGARRVVLPGGRAVWLRKYLRGGFARYFSRDLYLLRPERPLRELIMTESARAAGCRVPTVYAVRIDEYGPFYRGWIVTSAIENAEALIDRYLAGGPAERESVLAAAGSAIRDLHDAGIYHVDLTGHNLLVDGAGAVHVIDFDRALRAAKGDSALAAKGLARFLRSLSKLCKAAGRELDAGAPAWLDGGYRR